MKKPLLLGLIAATLVPAYSGTAWLLGRQIEAGLDQQYRRLQAQPYVKLVRRDYQRGVFSSTETATFEIAEPSAKAGAVALDDGEDASAGALAADDAGHQPLRFTVRSVIHHGPLPGLTSVAAATADSAVSLEGDTGERLAQALGDAAPLAAHTVLHFGGGGSAAVTGPAFAVRLPADGEEGDTLVSSAGLDVTLDFSRGLTGYSFRGSLPRLEVQHGQGERLVMTALQFDGNQRRVLDDEPLLMAGTQRFTLGELTIGDAQRPDARLAVRGLTYHVDVPVTGDFIDVDARFGAQSVQIGDERYGPAHYDVSLHHLHARTAARLYRAATQFYADTLHPTAAPPTLAPLTEPALALLNHGAELSLDRLSFATPQGEAHLSARARLVDAGPTDLGNPALLLARLEVAGELGVPEALLSALPHAAAQMRADAADEAPAAIETADARREQLRQQVAALERQGFVEREGGLIRSRVEFRNGRLAVNGKPVRAMTGAVPMGNPEMHPMQ